MITVEIYRNDTLAGHLSKNDDTSYSFLYTKEYLNDAKAKNISINFPLQEQAFHAKNLFPFFTNMLAEGNIKKSQCRNMKIDEKDSFSRLIKTAQLDTIGSVSVREVSV